MATCDVTCHPYPPPPEMPMVIKAIGLFHSLLPFWEVGVGIVLTIGRESGNQAPHHSHFLTVHDWLYPRSEHPNLNTFIKLGPRNWANSKDPLATIASFLWCADDVPTQPSPYSHFSFQSSSQHGTLIYCTVPNWILSLFCQWHYFQKNEWVEWYLHASL